MPQASRLVAVWILSLTLTAACGNHTETPSPVPAPPPASSAVPEQPRPDPPPSDPAQPTYTLSGQVRATPLSEAVADAQIEAVRGGTVVATASSGADGTYRISGLAAQAYVLRVIRRGYSVQSIDVVMSGDTTRNIVMARNRVTIQGFLNRGVDSCNAFIDEGRVEILDGPDAGKFDFSGIAVRYRIQDVAWGTFRMRASKEGFRMLETSVTVPPPVAVSGEIFETYFRLVDEIGTDTLTGEVSNRMLATAGQIDDALVEITRGRNTGRSTTSGSAGLGTGIYRFTGLLDGDAYVQVSKPGFVTEYLNTAQICGNYRADFRLIPTSASLGGIVRDESGAPLSGARVERLSPGSGTPQGVFVNTDANGRYAITGLEGTFVAIRVSKAGYLSQDRKMTIGPDMPGDFTLTKAP